ncbi:MAG: M42 family peptidase [Oscillospiraceae bacterium]|nr:M42 family peptidase [Oscillospiraceae bacterium]
MADKYSRLMTMLRELCELNSISGDESAVREYILEKIKGKCSYEISPLGNIIAYYKGKNRPENMLMISAHMDEVGMIITSVNDDGTLNFDCVGGVDACVCAGRQVTVGNGIIGSVGVGAVHNLSPDQKDKLPSFEDLCIDIGAADKQEAKKYVSLGDPAYFLADYVDFGEGFIRSKAIDDRAGCAVMLEMILSDALDYDCTFTFVVQEEIGLRGGRTAAFQANADFALVLEATTAADIPVVEGAKRCCALGKGPVISYMDRSTCYDRELYRLATQTAEKNGLKWQTKTMVAGGNDSGAIHISKGGIRTCAISVPCRYLHSPCCVINRSDFCDTYELASRLANKILGGEI